jgi:hypothetical protein
MTYRYQQPIPLTLSATGQPEMLCWRGHVYHVRAVYATWHLRDRWWEAATSTTPPARPASDRVYYRLGYAEGLICDVYFDRVPDQWVLDCVYD